MMLLTEALYSLFCLFVCLFVVLFLEQNMEPVGDRLDALLLETLGPVVQEGDGRSLGLSYSMKKFTTDKGPYIGL